MPGCGGPQVMIEALEKKLAPLSKNTCLRHCYHSCFCHILSTARMRLCSSPRCLSTLLLPDPHHRFYASLAPASSLGAVCLTISTAWIRLCPCVVYQICFCTALNVAQFIFYFWLPIFVVPFSRGRLTR